jgi:opacity protein-like surface antigen
MRSATGLLSAISCLAIAGFVFSPSTAKAADLEPIVEEEPFTWTGAYIGASVGFFWLDRDKPSRLCEPLDPRDEDSTPAPQDQQVGDESVEVGPNDFGLPEDLQGLTPAYACRPFELVNSSGDPGDGNDDVVAVFTDETSDDDNGWAAGAFIGVNRQYGGFVFGAELEGMWLSSDEYERNFNFAWFEEPDLEFLRTIGGGTWEIDGPDWIAYGTVKAGAVMGSMDQALLYVKGGFAAGDKQESSFSGDTTTVCRDCGGTEESFDGFLGDPSADSGYGFGGTAGVGIDYKLSQGFSVGAEYQFTFLNYSPGKHDQTHTMARENSEVNDTLQDLRQVTFTNRFEDLDLHMIKLRATLHFN